MGRLLRAGGGAQMLHFRANREKSVAARSCMSAGFMLATPDLHPFLGMLEDGRFGSSASRMTRAGRQGRGGGSPKITIRWDPSVRGSDVKKVGVQGS